MKKFGIVGICFFILIPIISTISFGNLYRKSLIVEEINVRMLEANYIFYGMNGEGRLIEKHLNPTCNLTSKKEYIENNTGVSYDECLNEYIAWEYLRESYNVVSLKNSGELLNGDLIEVTFLQPTLLEEYGLNIKGTRKPITIEVNGLTPYYRTFNEIPKEIANQIFEETEKRSEESITDGLANYMRGRPDVIVKEKKSWIYF